MGTTTIKESRLNIRCDSRTRRLLDKAASYAHVSVSEFVLSHALASAERAVQAHESITLKPKDFQAFLAALDAPAKPNAPGANAPAQAPSLGDNLRLQNGANQMRQVERLQQRYDKPQNAPQGVQVEGVK